MSDPEVLKLTDPTRYEHSFALVIAYFGPDYSVKEIGMR
jgi:hypothetical protein